MEKIIIDFEGYIEVDKNDLHLTKINENTSDMEVVDVTKLTTKEIIDGYKKGDYYLSLSKNYNNALDGEETCEISIDD